MLPLIYHPEYSYPFPGSHRFSMQKFRLLKDWLVGIGIASDENLFLPGKAEVSYLELLHESTYIHNFIKNKQSKDELRHMGLPWSEALVNRTLISPAGTLLTVEKALEHGIACHLAGGTHHAHRDFASGFCIFNDLALASKYAILQQWCNKVLIFDCDVHQGDGTAKLLRDDSEIFTCSIHCRRNFPLKKAVSDLDIELEDHLRDEPYLEIVKHNLNKCIDLTQPDLVIYDAGVDVFDQDPLGKISISLAGIKQREELVVRTCKEKGIPLATVIGGGYGNDEWKLAKRHALIVEAAHELW